MFVEVQRADGKATALCGVAGGLLAFDAAALSALSEAAWVLAAALAFASGLLGLAVGAALLAIRPVLPKDSALTGLEGICSDGAIEDVVAALKAMSLEDQLRVEALRLSMLAILARRKFRAIKVAVDCTVAALLMAGIGLLITFITS
ncbi:Pycsar system effector family protein [Streptomyces sp. CA-135486]|uniref:Pycsar system effector family protein n=1 Tax=Streptomyces sp. CA-135486 TaxID=3240049 RepID=UPI003D9266AC